MVASAWARGEGRGAPAQHTRNTNRGHCRKLVRPPGIEPGTFGLEIRCTGDVQEHPGESQPSHTKTVATPHCQPETDTGSRLWGKSWGPDAEQTVKQLLQIGMKLDDDGRRTLLEVAKGLLAAGLGDELSSRVTPE